jgi:undecaprenyl-diphosphatase
MHDIPEWLTYTFLGLLQGLTEFLPVSSSGHLVLAEKLFGYSDKSAGFEILLHLATLAVVLWVYRDDIARMLGNVLDLHERNKTASRDRALFTWIILGTLPVVVVVLPPVKDLIPLKDFAENLKNQTWAVPAIAIALGITGLLMFIADRLRSDDVASYNERGWRSVFIGIAQCIALIPGISRSGSTIFTGVLLGLSREDAARYSFLLSIPAILGAVVLGWGDVKLVAEMATVPVILGFMAAFVSGVFAINWLVSLLTKQRVIVFAVWCWLVAAAALWFHYFV